VPASPAAAEEARRPRQPHRSGGRTGHRRLVRRHTLGTSLYVLLSYRYVSRPSTRRMMFWLLRKYSSSTSRIEVATTRGSDSSARSSGVTFRKLAELR